mmetsp:Transcript_65681/g.186390  ORF Transcript_65681/g.186390 Transcript_65681/m.186390 type:complete len:301 (-) Transcript_65681:125-1027(-)|eukprot:CAMPEP_0168391950 /NCGR_PEP_ID=MMETSP0228-20121227/18248_1 /TAXON_ID=133427 /ORGANISM="Protoceratium reticulatum, Strain CCCM 535 (=CCMP 1889)" /LENGTH=300 /DNA_ID=CAMNT_0008405279 /DNA_START=50 /DNA_END=952 /DNA_ORIENTATION=+
MSEDPVLYECSDGVALITLNRPEQMNTWTDEMSHAWLDAYDRAAADPACRVIVITGKGRAWCAGADVTRLPGSGRSAAPGKKQPTAPPSPPPPDQDPRKTGLLPDRRGRHTTHALAIPKPIIACIQGAVAGGGFSQMMNCDIRFAAPGVTFTTAFARRGLIAEMGVSQTLPKVVGMGVAMDLILSGRKFNSDEALRLGIVQRILPKDELVPSTLAYARDIAKNVPPASLAVLKQQLLRHQSIPMEQVLRESNRLMIDSFRHPEHKEGVRSYLEKRDPTFKPYDEQHGLVSLMREIQSSKL